MKKIKYMILFFLLANVFNLSAQEDYNKAQQKPNQKEVILNKDAKTSRGYNSYQSAYKAALREAQKTYAGKTIAIRDLSKGDIKISGDGSVINYYNYTIVELPDVIYSALYDAIQKATATIEEESRFAIEKVAITDQQSDKENVKSQITNLLLNKGHKVVAKEYLENLKRKDHGSSIFDRTVDMLLNETSEYVSDYNKFIDRSIPGPKVEGNDNRSEAERFEKFLEELAKKL